MYVFRVESVFFGAFRRNIVRTARGKYWVRPPLTHGRFNDVTALRNSAAAVPWSRCAVMARRAGICREAAPQWAASNMLRRNQVITKAPGA
jgi:hypothetical protein